MLLLALLVVGAGDGLREASVSGIGGLRGDALTMAWWTAAAVAAGRRDVAARPARMTDSARSERVRASVFEKRLRRHRRRERGRERAERVHHVAVKTQQSIGGRRRVELRRVAMDGERLSKPPWADAAAANATTVAPQRRRLGGGGQAGRPLGTTVRVTLGVLAGTLVGAPDDSIVRRSGGRDGQRDDEAAGEATGGGGGDSAVRSHFRRRTLHGLLST